MTAFYNEIDPVAAQWLRNLIAAGHIAPGVVDERSIEDIKPEELYAYTQCHFFAGVGVWSLALRLAAWPDDRPIWTGSCPCQPFSAAGKGDGFADERHLWPAFYHLIAECRPAALLGEQVASAAVDPWIDLVHADLEALGYAFGSVPFPSAGVGAPHIRDRNYWVAQSSGQRRKWGQGAARRSLADRDDAGRIKGHHGVAGADETGVRLGDAGGAGLDQRKCIAGIPGIQAGACAGQAAVGTSIHPGGLADTDGRDASAERQQCGGQQRQQPENGCTCGLADAQGSGRRKERPDKCGRRVGDCQEGLAAGPIDGSSDLRPGPTNGLWRDADWIGCTDGKWRPVEPGTFPLAHGAAARVGRLRAYGNAINAEAARVWIETVMECL